MAHRLGRGGGSGDGGSIGSAVTFCALCGIGSGVSNVSNVSSVQICGDTSLSTYASHQITTILTYLHLTPTIATNQPHLVCVTCAYTHTQAQAYTRAHAHARAGARMHARAHACTRTNNSGQRTREVTERLGGVLVRFPGLRPCCYQHVHAKQVLHIRLFDRMLHCGVVVDRLGIRAHRCCKDGFNRSPKLRVDCCRIRVGKRAF